ncbi:MAG TPA: hypothetical protein VFP59_01930 [Candidatus Angelobacter sp.]|nr:hypothetical protein [Candidatus Angelobacter sp.]
MCKQKQIEAAWEPQWDEFREHRSRAWEDRQASSDEFDKNLLKFSSGALGLSLAFIKDIVKLQEASGLGWLYSSWLLFAGCIVVTIASYAFSQRAHSAYTDDLYKYYIEGKREFFNKKSIWSRAISACALVGSIFFLAGVISTVVFVIENISRMHK